MATDLLDGRIYSAVDLTSLPSIPHTRTMSSESSTSTLTPGETTALLTRTSTTLTEDVHSIGGHRTSNTRHICRELLLLFRDSTPGTLSTFFSAVSRIDVCCLHSCTVLRSTTFDMHGRCDSRRSAGSRGALHISIQLNVDVCHRQVSTFTCTKGHDPIFSVS